MLVVAGATLYLMTTSSTFDYAKLRVDGATYTDTATVEAALAAVRGENLFRIDTEPLEAALESLPTVADAAIGVALPDTLAVTLRERQPLLVWAVGDRRFLVDRDGVAVRGARRHGGPKPHACRSSTTAGPRRRRFAPAASSTRSTSTPRPDSRRWCRMTSAAPRMA